MNINIFNKKIEVLKDYVKNNKGPLTTESSHFFKGKNHLIGRCLERMRSLHSLNELNVEQEVILKSLGVKLKVHPSWEESYQDLVAFHKKSGHSNCGVFKDAPELRSLGYWATHQRRKKKLGKLKVYQINKLNEIDFAWQLKSRVPMFEKMGMKQLKDLVAEKNLKVNKSKGRKHLVKDDYVSALMIESE